MRTKLQGVESYIKESQTYEISSDEHDIQYISGEIETPRIGAKNSTESRKFFFDEVITKFSVN